MPGDPPKLTINGVAFTGALKLIRKPTGCEEKPAPHRQRVCRSTRADLPRTIRRVSDPQIPLTRLKLRLLLPIWNDNAARLRYFPAGVMPPVRRTGSVERNEAKPGAPGCPRRAGGAPRELCCHQCANGRGPGPTGTNGAAAQGRRHRPAGAVADISAGGLKASASDRPLRRCLPS